MNEDLHIEKAAHLADKPGAENLATDRARKFVADALASQEEEARPSKIHQLFVRKPVYAWSGIALALAACLAVAIVLFRPSASGDGVLPGYGTPGVLQENISTHAAGTEVTDTTITESSDTLTIDSIVLPE